MVRQNLTIITLIVSVALTALVGIQLFWIKNAIKLKKDDFRRDVRESMEHVVEKMEKHSNAEKIKEKIKLYKHGRAQKKSNQTEKEHINVKILEEFSIDSNGIISSSIKERQYLGDSGKNELKMPMDFSDSASDYEKLKSELVKKSAEMFNDLFDELISANLQKEYKPKLDTLFLDSLLKNELHQKGIFAEYERSIRLATKEDSITQTNLGHYRRRHGFMNLDPDKHIFRINITPNSAIPIPFYLTIQFPDEQNYLLRTMWLTLSSSAIIILSLVLAFFYTINTIRKQKKYTEIKNDFISNMTHEFKTPISTIALAGEMLSDASISKTPENDSRRK